MLYISTSKCCVFQPAFYFFGHFSSVCNFFRQKKNNWKCFCLLFKAGRHQTPVEINNEAMAFYGLITNIDMGPILHTKQHQKKWKPVKVYFDQSVEYRGEAVWRSKYTTPHLKTFGYVKSISANVIFWILSLTILVPCYMFYRNKIYKCITSQPKADQNTQWRSTQRAGQNMQPTNKSEKLIK